MEGLRQSGRKKVRHASIHAFPGHLIQSICTPTRRKKGRKKRMRWCIFCFSVNLMEEYNRGKNQSSMRLSILETGVHLIWNAEMHSVTHVRLNRRQIKGEMPCIFLQLLINIQQYIILFHRMKWAIRIYIYMYMKRTISCIKILLEKI